MKEAKKAKGESDTNWGKTRGTDGPSLSGEHQCCVKVCSPAHMCPPLSSGTRSNSKPAAFLPDQQVTSPAYQSEQLSSQHLDQGFKVKLGFLH